MENKTTSKVNSFKNIVDSFKFQQCIKKCSKTSKDSTYQLYCEKSCIYITNKQLNIDIK